MPTTINLKDTSLREVVAWIGRAHGINIQIDTRAMEDVGFSPDDELVTTSLTGVSLRSALRLILEQHDLTYVIRDEVLMITTPEEADNQLVTRLYPVTDMVRFKDPSGEIWADYDTLISLILSTIDPESWEEVGGPGSIAAMPYQGTEVVTIRQTDDAHDQVASLLASMRAMAGPRNGDEPPIRKRPEGPGSMYGGIGGSADGGMRGMGGMGGGMGGGMTSVAGGEREDRAASSGQKTDLLQELQETNRELQGEQTKQLDKMYKEGGAMGGMGSGFF